MKNTYIDNIHVNFSLCAKRYRVLKKILPYVFQFLFFFFFKYNNIIPITKIRSTAKKKKEKNKSKRKLLWLIFLTIKFFFFYKCPKYYVYHPLGVYILVYLCNKNIQKILHCWYHPHLILHSLSLFCNLLKSSHAKSYK